METFYTTALYCANNTHNNGFICDINGEELHIFKQMCNIARLKSRYSKCELKFITLSDRFCLFGKTSKGDELIFVAVIQ